MSDSSYATTPVLRWPAEAIWQAIEPMLAGFSVEVLPSIGSTNTELMRRAREGQYEPTLLVAEQQNAGRGRLGRPWVSQVGDSLTFSLGLPLAPVDWSGLSLAVGWAVAESLQPMASKTPDTPLIGLKWPNDLWLQGDRKLAGILIETASMLRSPEAGHTQADWPEGTRYVVIGIGVNIRPQPAQGLSTVPACWGDVQAGGTAPEALERLAARVVATVLEFARTGFAPLQQRFHARDILQGRLVTLSNGESGLAQGVGTDGAFLVHTAKGLQTITSAELSVRPSV